jgi:hypothetical protein
MNKDSVVFLRGKVKVFFDYKKSEDRFVMVKECPKIDFNQYKKIKLPSCLLIDSVKINQVFFSKIKIKKDKLISFQLQGSDLIWFFSP